jgi:hypothetical protein
MESKEAAAASEAKDSKADDPDESSQSKIDDRAKSIAGRDSPVQRDLKPKHRLNRAASKDAPLSSVQPDGKRDDSYWKGSDGVLKRATAFIYRRIIAPREEGGMKGFFEDNCGLFKGINKADEQSLEFMPL